MGAANKELVDEIFSITGKVVDEGDPVVTAALFFSHKMKEAALDAATHLNAASLMAHAAAAAAEAACSMVQSEQARFIERISRDLNEHLLQERAERARLSGELDGKLQRWLKNASRFHSTDGTRLIPAWYAFAALFAGAVLCAALAWAIYGINSSTLNEIEVGRQLNSVWPSLDADLRKRLIEAIDNRRR